jgi:hypothetical protein
LKVPLYNIRSDYEGFTQLVQLSDQLKDVLFENIDIDMSRVAWFDANMCAPLGAILYKVSRNFNTVTISNLPRKVESILSKNGFLSNYGRAIRQDTYRTTIQYQRFEPEDDRYFGSYINKHLVGKGVPKMSSGLRKKFQESIFEIFSNAVIHSKTELGIYSCGQFFPNKKRLDFSVADLGIGIRHNLQENIGIELPDEKAIEWAMTEGNTTKTGPVPGGLGLKLLREFILMNQGRLQIVSDRGYWELKEGNKILRSISYPFPGTVVNLEFNTADTNLYILTSEIPPEEIF